MSIHTQRSSGGPHFPPRAATAFLAVALVTSVSLMILVMSGCRSAPVSGRKQLVLIPEAQEIELGVRAYSETLAEEPISQDAEINAMVERVGRRIAAVANKPDYDWEFKVIAKNVQNAFALPGGKVAVYEGILPVCQTEAGLAVVMSHEVAHALARHGGERMSQESVVQGVGTVINAVSQRKASEATTEKIMQVYGASSQYGVILPFSRKHESEADAIGLILMAKAGYDPSVAPEFWERFSSASSAKPPEWLSTHPADSRRAADLRELLPEAMKYYEAAKEQYSMGEAIPVERLASLKTTEPVSPSGSKVETVAALRYGGAGALTGPQSSKRGSVEHAVHTEPADSDSSAVRQTSAETATSVMNAQFHKPVTSTDAPVDELTTQGWEAAREPNPFENQNPFE